ncbi:MAG: hypothetical protein QOE00_1918 [Ilumatobacteraceae bacterium]
MFRFRELVLSMAIVGVSTLTVAANAQPAFAAGRTNYVDCVTGNDTYSGSSPTTAWATVTRANKATMAPGDSLLFKRGCVWTGKGLNATWIGTAQAPITISTYGTDPHMPRIADAGGYGILVSGQYEVIDGFEVGFKPVKLDPCGQPLGNYYALVITQGGAHDTIANNLLTTATVGLHISKTAGGYNTITRNTLAGNNVMEEPFDGAGDLGAWGMLVRGSNNEISYNTFRDNRAVCLKSKYLASNSVEIYEGDNNNIHHNTSTNDRVFSELGGSATNKATNNNYSFNLDSSNVAGARFITTRGADDTTYGPVLGTVADRNTIFFTGAGSQGLVCSLGCNPDIFTARYNIIDVVEKTIYFDKTMGLINNLLWSHGLAVKIEDGAKNMRTMPLGTTPETIVADPRFVDPANGDFRLLATSPGIDKGGLTGYTTDLQGNPASNGAPDIGAYEDTAATPPPPPPVPTLLANSGFEADVNGDSRPDSWTSNASFTVANAPVHDGSTAGQHVATDNSSYVTKQSVSGLTGGTSYHFGGWVNIPTTTDAFTFKLQVQWRGPAGTIATTTVKSYTAATNGWDEVATTVAAPAGTTSAQIMMNVGSLNASIIVDELTFGL